MYDQRASPFDSYTNLVDKTGNLSHEHEIRHRNWSGEVHFRPIHQKTDDFGAISSPARSPSRPLLGHRSPESRAQAIARGRSELMEMVRHMPESNYELSLKDIVEHKYREENQIPKTEAVKVKKEESRRVERNLSLENKGLFLNMAFPFSFKSRRRKKNGGGNSGRVSPKPEGLKAGGERDLWKKKFTGSSDSDSSRISDNSGTSTSTTVSSGATSVRGGDDQRGRRGDGFMTGCFQLFISKRRSKSAE